MEKRLFRDILLPLEEIALKRVVVSLCIDTLNSNWSLLDNFDLVADEISDKVSKILPASLKERMIPFVRVIGSEILHWQTYHENILPDKHDDFSFHSLKHLHWTCMGTIDYRKTAEKLIVLKMFDVTKRYELACLYCLEDYIPLLWEEVSEEYKKHLKEQFYFSVELQLRYYWAYLLKGEEYKFSCIFKTRLPEELSFYQFAFKQLAVQGNKAAARYFFQKLSNRERESSLYFTICSVLNKRFRYLSETKPFDFPKQSLSDVLFYLLSLMNLEQQMLALKKCPCTILASCLDWPLNDLFLEVANVIWTFLPKIMYEDLLSCMLQVIRTSGYYNPKLFQEFFLKSPGSFREVFVNRECAFYGYFMPEFFHMQDSETIKVIFRNIQAADRVKLVFCQRVFSLLCDSISQGEWHIVEVCIREAMLSKEDGQRLKTDVLEYMTKNHRELGVEERTHKRKRFCEFFDDPCTNADGEESSKDETLTDVKKLSTDEEKNVPPKN
ncbi:uncharacterized protein LOC129958659 [Argiope bruennichi]|uniref:uncharacterized protein LOC129958659 n=1 Tax=Argiope bruennichi TaxID=94029 RepID=UPI0024957E3C|nr:uncharacterized protein LOC129958659 [Argiope bruennichi]